jgi:hypothetical protein
MEREVRKSCGVEMSTTRQAYFYFNFLKGMSFKSFDVLRIEKIIKAHGF